MVMGAKAQCCPAQICCSFLQLAKAATCNSSQACFCAALVSVVRHDIFSYLSLSLGSSGFGVKCMAPACTVGMLKTDRRQEKVPDPFPPGVQNFLVHPLLVCHCPPGCLDNFLGGSVQDTK